ncbi:hypothetical protein B0H12DRAFT_1228938 [Mycena haematopus]|nr:hypothetical protein B0H12DRAFT_1228938 [Mycena haematopus]
MQFRIITLVVSLLAIAVSAAPVPESGKTLDILNREIEHAPLVRTSEVTLEPEPESGSESESATEEIRACRMYTCIWYVRFTIPLSQAVFDPRATELTSAYPLPCTLSTSLDHRLRDSTLLSPHILFNHIGTLFASVSLARFTRSS